MKNTATLNVTDHDSQGAAVIIVRHDQNYVALALSLLEGGDTELLLEKNDVKKLIVALQQAVDGR